MSRGLLNFKTNMIRADTLVAVWLVGWLGASTGGLVYTLITEYAERQWAVALAAGRRMRPELGALLEGQKILVMQCTTKGCRHYAASAADPCMMEEARVLPPRVKSGWLGASTTQADNRLMTLLQRVCSCDRPDGYRCDGCKKVNTTQFRSGYHRLPAIYAVHLNRTQMDGSRCSASVDFPVRPHKAPAPRL